MKLKINYDLVDKISEAKNGIVLEKTIINAAANFPLVILAASSLISLVPDCPPEEQIIAGFMTGTIGYCAIATASFLKCLANKQEYKEKAIKDLNSLSNQLVTFGVRTSVEHLKEAKVSQVYYKVEYIDEEIKSKKLKQYLNSDTIKVPRLKEYKYINVLLDNECEESLLQEHIFGDSEYELSVHAPSPKMQPKLVKAAA